MPVNTNVDITSENEKKSSYWYLSAKSTAIVGTVLTCIILVFLILNYIRTSVVQNRRELELVKLKTEILSRPDDEQLLTQIRQLDLQFRQNWFRNLDFSHRGGYLLLVSVVIMLVGFKCAGTLNKKMPAPQPATDRLKEQDRDAKLSRRAVTIGLTVLALGALLLMIRPGIEFSEPATVNIYYPSDEQLSRNWPSFRGPGGLGVSTYTNIPTSWDGLTGEGILWKSQVPFPGFNSPVVWQDRIFLSGADPNEQHVFCYDANSGGLLWTGDVTVPPLKEGEEPVYVMEDTGYAAPTVTTDGQRVYAIFPTGVVGCFDFDGNKIWEEDLGRPENYYGFASSLTMFQHLVLIQFDQGTADDDKSKMIALDGSSGHVVWQTKRPSECSWASPIVVKIDDQYQLITCSTPWVIAHNPADGTELWRAECLSGDTVPSPIYANGLVIAIKVLGGSITAIRPDGRGDVTETHISWSINESVSEICSPVSNGEFTFLIDGTYLVCFKTADGSKLWEHNLEEYFSASPSLVGDKLYLLSDKGNMFIIEVGLEYKELARCELGEICFASPAFMDGRIYIRSLDNLFCIGN